MENPKIASAQNNMKMTCDQEKQFNNLLCPCANMCPISHSTERINQLFRNQNKFSTTKIFITRHTRFAHKHHGMFVNKKKIDTCTTVAIFGCNWVVVYTHSPKSSSPTFHSPFSTKMAARSNQQKSRFII